MSQVLKGGCFEVEFSKNCHSCLSQKEFIREESTQATAYAAAETLCTISLSLLLFSVFARVKFRESDTSETVGNSPLTRLPEFPLKNSKST